MDNLYQALCQGSPQESALAAPLCCISSLVQSLKAGKSTGTASMCWQGLLFRYPKGALSLILEKSKQNLVLDFHTDAGGKLCLGGMSDACGAALLTYAKNGFLTFNRGDGLIAELPISPKTASLWALGALPANRFLPPQKNQLSECLLGLLGKVLEIPPESLTPPSMPIPSLPDRKPPENPQPGTCPACGTVPASTKAKFCRSCGAELPPPAPSSRQCKKCGFLLRPQSKFCPNCGTAAHS